MNATLFDRRRAGLLAPVFALRHARDFGIGDTLAVREAIDFCADHHFSVLQVLPIHETFGDHSPYNPISSRALSPALLEISPAAVPGLTAEMLEQAAPGSWLDQLRGGKVRYDAISPLKSQILLAAWYASPPESWPDEMRADFDRFRTTHADWLEPYTLYRVLIREYEGNTAWEDWRPEHRQYPSANSWALQHPAREEFEAFREGFAYIQWVAWRQWRAVREHADARGVRLLGEISFGVGVNSADVWANPSLFDLEWNLGTRPLAHFDTNKDSERWGQNWGLPPYRWENHRSSGFTWLRGRVTWEKEFFHGCRLDHLRGYFRAYMFPWAGGARHVEFSSLNEEEAALLTGGRLPRFVPGPDDDPVSARMNELQGRELVGQLAEAAGEMDLVAEIMGDMPGYIREALEDLQLANLSFPQLERNPDRTLRPASTMRVLSLVSYANHDNAPLASLYLHLRQEAVADPAGPAAVDLHELLRFAGWEGDPPEALDAGLLLRLQDALMATPCLLAVLMCSDLLGIPLRFNLPGSYGKGTWSDRLEMPLQDLARHPVYGPRIAAASALIAEHARLGGDGGDGGD